MRVAIVDGDGRVLNVLLRPEGALGVGELDLTGVDTPVGPGWTWTGGQWVSPEPALGPEAEAGRRVLAVGLRAGISLRTPPPVEDVEGWRELASRIVDSQAGAIREALGTPGYGQTVEYERTEADARAYLAALAADPDTDPAAYPMLAAEIQALEQATGEAAADVAAADVAQEILDLATAWGGALAAIKTLRRGAKLRIEIAADVGQIAEVLDELSWPGQESEA